MLEAFPQVLGAWQRGPAASHTNITSLCAHKNLASKNCLCMTEWASTKLFRKSEDAHLNCKGLGRFRARQFRRIHLHAVIVVIIRPGLSLCDSSTEHI